MTTVIQIVLIKYLWFKISLQSELQFVIVNFLVYIFDSYNEILEILLPCRLIMALMAFGVMNKLTLEIIFDKVLMNIMLTFSGE